MAEGARERSDSLLTIDELALSTGLTVRTTRYYASLGLLPTPVRRGRMAYYGPGHLARLHLIRALQDHGLRDGLTASRALGYAQVLRFLAGECTEDEARDVDTWADVEAVRSGGCGAGPTFGNVGP